MSRSGAAVPTDWSVCAETFRAPVVADDVRLFAPFNRKYLLFENMVVPLGEKLHLVLGSDPVMCDMVLLGARISRQHAMIFYHDGCYFLQDLGSVHGTYINGYKISGMVELHPGDEIGLKPYVMSFREN